MLPKIRAQLESLWHSIQQEFRVAPVKTSLASIGLCTLLGTTLINFLVQHYFPAHTIKFLTITTENNLLLIILSVGLLALSLTMLRNYIITADILHKYFGVYWDVEHNMYCLSCQKPLKNSSIGSSIFFCSDPKCNSKHILKDNDGTELSRQQAIDRMINLKQVISQRPIETKIETTDSFNPDILLTKSIISHIEQNKRINQPATPRILSLSLNLSPECLLSHMMKMHNDKLITFITGGKQPDVDTDFFFSPKE